MNLRQLEQFVAVAETESFSRGAERARSSQPALSTAISKLENELGVRLLNRRKRVVTLTTEGRRLLISAKKILSDFDDVRVSFRKTAEVEDLRIGVCETLDLTRFAPLLEQYRSSRAHIRLKVFEGSTPLLCKRLLAGDLEVAFLVTAGSEVLPKGVVSRSIKSESYRLVIPRNHSLANLKSVPVSVLNDAPFIARMHCEYRHLLARLLTEKQIRPKVTYRTVQDERALELIRAGLGMGVFPESLIPTGMVSVALDGENPRRQIHLARKEGRPTRNVVQFAEFIDQTRI